jgi:hypothetical protein
VTSVEPASCSHLKGSSMHGPHMLARWLTRSGVSSTSNGIPILHAITGWGVSGREVLPCVEVEARQRQACAVSVRVQPHTVTANAPSLHAGHPCAYQQAEHALTVPPRVRQSARSAARCGHRRPPGSCRTPASPAPCMQQVACTWSAGVCSTAACQASASCAASQGPRVPTCIGVSPPRPSPGSSAQTANCRIRILLHDHAHHVASRACF